MDDANCDSHDIVYMYSQMYSKLISQESPVDFSVPIKLQVSPVYILLATPDSVNEYIFAVSTFSLIPYS